MRQKEASKSMYGQKASLGIVSTGVSIASWWMWGATVTLAAVAVILLGRTFITLASNDERRRP
jgi:hypothetical protein